MFESLYITLVILAFMMLVFSFFVGQKEDEDSGMTPRLAQPLILLGISTILFGALAAASAEVEFITCTTTTCNTSTHFFDENMYIFGFFALISGVIFLIKSFDAFYFAKGKL